MDTPLQALHAIAQQASTTGWRYGVVLRGDAKWQDEQLHHWLTRQTSAVIFSVGLRDDFHPQISKAVGYKQGQRLLGQECQILVVDTRQPFDANSFTAACGALVGGGILLILPSDGPTTSYAQAWLERHFAELVQINKGQVTQLPQQVVAPAVDDGYAEQRNAIDLVKKVLTGHRKRPLMLTADRGRGKSSALGLACGQLMQQRPLKILLTAPSFSAVETLFFHAQTQLPNSHRVGKFILRTGESSLQFIAPDELLSQRPSCDLLLVDEAAAIPLPMLKAMVADYHRLVFSSTVHGYEGCGRGFSNKFIPWLQVERPGMKAYHLEQPIRWKRNDPLEAWLNRAFLLQSDDVSIDDVTCDTLSLRLVSKAELLAQPAILQSCFSLLVNAHYQTTPNDLLQLLADEACQLYLAQAQNAVVCCILTVDEGGLEADLIKAVQLGHRRPAGHLVATTIANHLGITQAAQQSATRVMRIAVHPDWQGRGIGQNLLAQLQALLEGKTDYLATSFGASAELVRFWQRAGYVPLRLGFSRDAASGCHSLVMVKALSALAERWQTQAHLMFKETLPDYLSSSFSELDAMLVRSLLNMVSYSSPNPTCIALIVNYAEGGNSFDSVQPWLKAWLLSLEVQSLSDLLISKVLLNQSWQRCAERFAFPGRKQAEQALRDDVRQLVFLSNLQCKLDHLAK